MRNFHVAQLLIFVFACILFSGCRALNRPEAKDDGTFPASIGTFKRDFIFKEEERNYLNEKNKNQKFKSKQAHYKDGEDQITYGISTHQTAEDAVNEQEKEATHSNNTTWKKLDLKDKNGKNVGKLTICRNFDKSLEEIAGNTNYSLAFNIDNQNHFVNLYNLTWKPQTTDKVVAFVKALPVAAQLDLSFLDLITSGNADNYVTAEKIAAISPPVKLAPAPYLKGKTVVVSIEESSKVLKTNYYFPDSTRQAYLMEEVGSIVRVECGKGSKIGEYLLKETNTKIPAFSSVCKVTIIDNTIPAVIAQKTFTNSTMVEYNFVKTDKNGELSKYDKEYVAPKPTDEMNKYVEKLPKK